MRKFNACYLLIVKKIIAVEQSRELNANLTSQILVCTRVVCSLCSVYVDWFVGGMKIGVVACAKNFLLRGFQTLEQRFFSSVIYPDLSSWLSSKFATQPTNKP